MQPRDTPKAKGHGAGAHRRWPRGEARVSRP